MCRQPDVTVNPDQGHHLLAANMECMVLLTLTGEGEAGAGAANSFLFKTSCSQTFTHSQVTQASFPGAAEGLVIAASPWPQVRLGFVP